MKYTITPIEDQEYLLLSFEGDSSLEQIERSREDLKKALISHCWTKVLIETTRITTILPIIDLYEIAKDLTRILPPTTKTALITKTENEESFRFFENVARNRGSNYRVFVDYQQALNWLLEE